MQEPLTPISEIATAIYIVLYLVILALHFFYARYLLKTGRVDLSMGPIRSQKAILTGLLILNGVSLIAFTLPIPILIAFQIFLHVALALDEMWRTWKVRARWVFLLNHVLFTVLLTAWLVQVSHGMQV